MKINLLYITFVLILMSSCKEQAKTPEASTNVEEKIAYFGGNVNTDEALSTQQLIDQLKTMRVGDTVALKIQGSINSVCQKKGCWMRVAAGEEELMVRFKDYGFFVPKDASGKETTVQGVAFVEETSVEDLKHYAMDAGSSEEEIAAITTPKRTYSFTADAVAIHN